MKEGVTLFCPKCGNPVSKDDNFCTSCGHKLKNVKINITSDNNIKKISEDTNKVKKVSQNTRVFDPRSLDAIDTTDELKNIIAEVDKKISKNIKDYENNNIKSKTPNKDRKSIEKPKKSSENKKINILDNIEIEKPSKSTKLANESFDENILDDFKDSDSSNKMSQKELIRRVQEELKKSNFDEEKNKNSHKTSSPTPSESNFSLDKSDKEEKEKSSKKFSLKEKWNNFIKEDDDEYSIFADLKDDTKKKEDTRNLEISKSVQDTDKSFENTLSTPKIDIENALEESNKEKSKSVKEDKKSTTDKKQEEKVKKDKTDNKVSSVKEEDKKKTNLKQLFTFKDKGEKPVKDTKKVSSNFEKSLENNLSDKVSNVESKISKTSNKGIDKILFSLDKVTNKLSDYIGLFGSKESKIVIGVGILLNLIMLILGSGSFKFVLLAFLILKIAFDYLEFYLPLNIATDRDNIDTSYPEVKKFALINWIICKVVLFVGFIISPFGGFFKYNILQALTPMPLATLILIGLSLLIGLNLYKDNFIARSKINFVGWYAIAFTLLELLFKMIWFIINFIFVTLF